MFGFVTVLLFQFSEQIILDADESPLFKECGLHTVTKADNFVDFQEVLKIKIYTILVKRKKMLFICCL